MIDGAIPIFIDGEHIAYLFTGQFFLDPPDMDYFEKQAAHYGYDKEKYLDAIREVPVLNKKTVEQGLLFLGELAGLIALMGLKQKELLDLKNKLEQRVETRTLDLKKAYSEKMAAVAEAAEAMSKLGVPTAVSPAARRCDGSGT